MKSSSPPRWPDRFLKWYCSKEVLETLQGDLYELYQIRSKEKGRFIADLLFTLDVIDACRPFAFKKKKVFDSNNTVMIGHYLKVSGRNLLRHKAYAMMNIGGLGLALACCILFILYMKDELSFDTFHEKQSRIYRITSEMDHDESSGWEDYKSGKTGMIQGPEFKNSIPEIEDYTRLTDITFIVRHESELVKERSLYVDESFFSTFSFSLLKGDPRTALHEPNSVVMTEATAIKYFGTTDVVGKSIELGVDGKFENFMVTGLIERSPGNSSIPLTMLVPFSHRTRGNEDPGWMNFYLNTFVVLHPQANVKDVEAKFSEVFLKKAGDQLAEVKKQWGFNGKCNFGLQPLAEMHLQPEMDLSSGLSDGREPMYIYILGAIAIFILLIACINFINVAIAQSLKRSKEVGVRKVVGSMRSQLMGQFLGEAFTICFMAFVLAGVMAWLCLPLFNQLTEKNMSLSYLADWRLIAGILILFVTTTMAAGFYPAIIYSGFKPVNALYGNQRLNSKSYLAKGLVVLQFALSGILIISTVAVYSQFNFIINKDLGFNEKDLVTISLPWWRKNDQAFEQLKTRLGSNASVLSIAGRNGGRSGNMAEVDGKKKVGTDVGRIDYNYFSTLEVPIIEGRNFSEAIPSDTTDAAIVNEAFVRAAGWTNPLGKTVDFFGINKKYVVIGVAKDYHFRSLKEEIAPHLYTLNYMGIGQVLVRINSSDIPQTLITLKDALREVIPAHPFEYDFVETAVARQYEQEAKWKQVITYAAVISIFISCMGLLGLTTLLIGQRTREIAIRKVMGAPIATIINHLSGGFMRLTLIAFLIAAPVGHYVTDQWLGRFAYRVHIQWWMYLAVGVVSLLIAFVTISFKSIKAAQANPVQSLNQQ